MHIEKIKILVNLKAGNKRWEKGSIIEAPIPPELISEVRADTGLIEILEDKVVEEAGTITDSPTTHVFIDPEEKEVKIENIWQYCKDRDLSYNGFNNLAKGRSKTHKGWTYKGGE